MNHEAEDIAIAIHRERIAKVLSRTGGEAMHPDHYDFRQALRDAILTASDEAADEHGMARLTDADLPELFRSIDPIAERLWARSLGYKA